MITIEPAVEPVTARFLRVPEAAETLGLSVSTVEKLVRNRAIASCKFGGARRIERAALERFVAKRTTKEVAL